MIADLLRFYPRTKRDLAEAAGMSTREVELEIQRLRLEGHAILSDSAGYWLSDNPREVRECAERLRRRYIHQAITARALRSTARRLERQPTLWGTL